MAFVYEIVPEEDKEFWLSMELKNCWGKDPLPFVCKTTWCADRERNAFLNAAGGGFHEVPEFYDLWWNGTTIRIETEPYGYEGNREVGYDIIWKIYRIPIPKLLWDKKDEIIKMIYEAFSVNPRFSKAIEFVKSITVNILCEPECV